MEQEVRTRGAHMTRRQTYGILAVLCLLMTAGHTACRAGETERGSAATQEEIRSNAPGDGCQFRDLTAESVEVGLEPGQTKTEEETR